MKIKLMMSIVCLSAGLFLFAGCNQSESVGSADDSGDFASGAFPPTLSAKDYHEKAWITKDCLVCHEKGVNKAPKVVHSSMTELAKKSKCRTCHVPTGTSVPGK